LVDATARPTRVPVATYRLQFNSNFTFNDARAIVPYLRQLGISDCYASSYLKAVPGSGHGYDIADPTRLNPEIGSDEEYSAWIDALHAHEMSHVIDLVPNHLGIARSSNPWWTDVLENGPSSRFARFFDIEWHPVKAELADKVLLPILGDQYGAALERQELQLAYQDGAFVVRYYDDWLPIAPDTYGPLLAGRLDDWVQTHCAELAPEDVDELRSIITAAEHLPGRSSRDPEFIATRAREKDVIKRRLAAVLDRAPSLRAYVDEIIRRYNGRADDPGSFDDLDALLNQQSYRLAHWRVASEEINYRRFFDVNQLAALRMEDPAVFDEVHRFVFDLLARGAATGLRVDHVDGLYSPKEYLSRLQARAAEALGQKPLFVIVEKILGGDERLPGDWPVHGTTGYEFAAVVNGLFVETQNARVFEDIYARFLHARRDELVFDDLAYRCKRLIMHETMSGDINSLGHQLNRFSERNRHFRDFTLYSLISTIKEVIACFPVYRTYVTAKDPIADHDRRYITQAIRCAKRRAPATSGLVFDFIEQLLLKRTAETSRDETEARAKFIGKFQQITSPISAKGIEDTALYTYNRLLSLNEVGADPTQFGMTPEAVHDWMVHRQQDWPLALSTTSTHDTKRGEDVRARLNVLSGMPDAWRRAVGRWRVVNRRFKTDIRGAAAPSPNEEYFLYQTLVGAWPFSSSDASLFGERLKCYMTKALREAKVNTSWLGPDEEYESAVLKFVDAVLVHRPFLQHFLPFQATVAELGIYNSLSQTLIKITAPGIPDFYQGTELWDLSLVDPDNRRPVDYEQRREMLNASAEWPPTADADDAQALLSARTDGRIKLFTMTRALRTRADRAELFERGTYVPLSSGGRYGDAIFAFARSDSRGAAVTCVPRLLTNHSDAAHPPVGRDYWEDTFIELPPLLGSTCWRDAFTGITLRTDEAYGNVRLDVARIFEHFPVSLLVSPAQSA
jgi:(1->4)-alpha-D-glucan 1-alpha-D-glucosylmutase